MSKNNKNLYGLPLDVKFCNKCVISNQRPSSTVEFKTSKIHKKEVIHFDDNGICSACNFNETKMQNIDWDEREKSLLKLLSQYETLVFMTGHPEPTPRVAIEAKMLNCSLITQKHLIGVSYEDYFHLTGNDMIEEVRSMRDSALKQLEEWTCE